MDEIDIILRWRTANTCPHFRDRYMNSSTTTSLVDWLDDMPKPEAEALLHSWIRARIIEQRDFVCNRSPNGYVV